MLATMVMGQHVQNVCRLVMGATRAIAMPVSTDTEASALHARRVTQTQPHLERAGQEAALTVSHVPATLDTMGTAYSAASARCAATSQQCRGNVLQAAQQTLPAAASLGITGTASHAPHARRVPTQVVLDKQSVLFASRAHTPVFKEAQHVSFVLEFLRSISSDMDREVVIYRFKLFFLLCCP